VVRKTVTVLFADVTGSTRMGERLDPEALRRVMTRYFEVSRTMLERHGATVEKFIGDAVMAVFGVPAVHEDDALRAVRAAFELRREVSGLGIELRIGVNTGEVVTSVGETLVTGDAVNVAARLEQAASPGEILVGDATYRLARDALRVEPLPPVEAKGKSEPVVAWRLVEVLDDTPAFTRRIDAPFVGRVREIGQLVASFERVALLGAAERVTVLGAPGIGKSRLARELLQRVGGEARVVVGRCLAYGEGITYWPLQEIVRTTAGMDRDAIAATSGDEAVAAWIAAAIGLGGVGGTKEETQWAARRYLEVLADERPLVVVLDDLHWAEQTFLDLVEYVSDFATAPMLLLCTARADLLDARPAWNAPRPNSHVIPLEPLPAEDAAALARELDDEARQRILEIAEGNPLFVEQLVAMQMESHGEIRVPPTLQALLAARVDSLSPSERTVIERASIEGRFFHRGTVTELLPETPPIDVAAQLLALVRKEFVRPDRSRLPGDDGYLFVHVLVRDAAYESMSKELRADLHERFAGRIERVAPDRPAELEEILAYHLEKAFLYRRELDLPDENQTGGQAATLLARSGIRAYHRGDLPAAQNLLERGAALLSKDDASRARTLAVLGAAMADAAGGTSRALDVVERALAEGVAAGDEAAEASAWAIRERLRLRADPSVDMAGIQRESEKRALGIEQLGDPGALVSLRRLELEIALTRVVNVGNAAERLLEAARRADDRPNAFEALFFWAASGIFGPVPVADALIDIEQLKSLSQGPREQAALEHIEGLLRGMAGELDDGLEIVRAARRTFAEFGMKTHAVGTARDEGLIERYRGDAAAVERALLPATDELRELGESALLSLEIGELADAYYELERLDDADAATRESERLAQPADLYPQVTWRRVRAKLLARQGEGDQAVRLANEAIDLAQAASALELLGDAYRDLAEVERVLRHEHRAIQALERAVETYDRKGLLPMAVRSRKELETLGDTADDRVREAGPEHTDRP
jgi:class 3 adenylate cyclase/tetratricopeptide (TPR) repeat protein